MVALSPCFSVSVFCVSMADQQPDGQQDAPDVLRCVNCELNNASLHCVQCPVLRPTAAPKAVCEACLSAGNIMVGKVKAGDFVCLWCSSKEAEASFDSFRASFLRTWAIGGLPEVVLQVAPWYPVILEASLEEKAASLRAIKYVLPSREQSFAEALMSQQDGQHLVNLMAVNLSHSPSASPSELNAFTKKVLESAAQKYGVHRKYADLLLPEKGGGLAVARDHFRSVLTQKSSPLTVAMCHERLFILDEVANRYTPAPKLSKKVSPPVVCRREGLVLCLSLFRTLSREIKNASQAPSDSSAVFDAMYTSRILRAWNRPAAIAGHQDVPSQQQRASPGQAKVCKEDDGSRDVPTSGNAPRGSKRPSNPGLKGPSGSKLPKSSQLVNPVVPFARPAPASNRQAPCPNCLRAGTKVFHSLSVCHFLGNTCRIPCGAKKSDNSVCDGVHWRAACPHKAVSQA